MQAIVNRLKNALSGQCLPEKLTPSARRNGAVLRSSSSLRRRPIKPRGCTDPGHVQPGRPTTCGCAANDTTCITTYQGILQRFQNAFQASLGGASQPTPVACIFKQLAPGLDFTGVTCEGSTQRGWCYVEGAANTGGCPQAIKFGGTGPPAGTTMSLVCPQ